MYLDTSYDKSKEAAESYFESLEEELELAENTEKGEFEMWQDFEDANFYIIYFNEKSVLNLFGKRFVSDSFSNKKNNYICSCYYDVDSEEAYCVECMSLEKDALLLEMNDGEEKYYGEWGIRKNEKVEIYEDKDKFIFRRIE
ncbi:MAG: hypothetical protein ACOCUI_00180 [bacterium]